MQTLVYVKRKGGFARFAFFGRDQNHSVGGAGTINSCGCAIFEHFNGFDIVGGKHVDAARGRHAINDEERIVVAQGIDPTDADGNVVAGCAGGLGDLYPRNLALQGLIEAQNGEFGDVFGFYGTDGRGHVGAKLPFVAHHHHVL